MKKRIILLILVFIFTITAYSENLDTVFKNLVNDFEKSVTSQKVLGIGTFVYADKNVGSSFSNFLIEKLGIEFGKSRLFDPAPREKLDAILEEIKFGMSGLVDDSTAVEPGIVIVAGIQNEPKILFRILDVFENDNVFELISNCVQMRKKWGFGLDSRILPWWYGDQDKFRALILKTSAALEKVIGYDQGLYIKDLVDLRERHAFPLYIRQLFNARKTGLLEKPSLSGFMNIVGYIQGFNRELAEKTKTEDYPAIGLLAGMIHSLQIERPWEEEVMQGEAFNIAV